MEYQFNDKLTHPRPEPEFEPGDFVDAFGYLREIERRWWSETSKAWEYTFVQKPGVTPETEISEPTLATDDPPRFERY
jgi:hypothetical protein